MIVLQLDADNAVSDTSQTHTLNNDKHNNTDTSQSQHTERMVIHINYCPCPYRLCINVLT